MMYSMTWTRRHDPDIDCAAGAVAVGPQGHVQLSGNSLNQNKYIEHKVFAKENVDDDILTHLLQK